MSIQRDHQQTHPGIVDLFQCIVTNRAQKYHTLNATIPVGSNQLHTDHFAIPYENIVENFIEVVHHEANVRIGDLLAFAFSVHLPPTWRSVHLLRVSSQHLKLLWRSPRTNRQRQRVIELMDHQIQVNRLLPVYIRIADRQFTRILSKHFDFRFILWHHPGGSFDVFLAHEEQQIIAIDAVLFFRLEEKVPHEEIRPIGCTLQDNEATIWNIK